MKPLDRSPGLTVFGSTNHAVLLLHGLGGSPAEMAPLKRHLEKSDFHVEVPVLPGHGTSVCDLRSRRWEEWLIAAKKVFQSLEGRFEYVSVGGICMGAVVSLLLAGELGAHVSKVVSISTTLYYDGWGLPWYSWIRHLAYRTPLLDHYDLPEGDPYGVKNLRVRRWIASHMTTDSKTHYSKIPLRSIREMETLISVTKNILPRIQSPTLAIHPIQDDVTSLRSVDHLEAVIPKNLFKKVLLNDSYHLATIDNQKELVCSSASKFLQAGES